MTKFQFCELSVSKQRPRNNQTVIVGNEHYDTLIVLETQDSQIPENNEQENGETNDSFLISQRGCHQRKPEQRLILHQKISNLSGITSSKNQIKLLSKGLKLSPTPEPVIPETKRDIELFTRKLRLRKTFANENGGSENSQDSSDFIVRNKGKLKP